MGGLFLIIINLVFCLLIAKVGEKRKIGFGWSFVLCIFLSPIMGGIITMLSAKKVNEESNNKEDNL